MPITPAWRVECSGPCRRWLSIPDSYQLDEHVPLAALVPAPTAGRAGMWLTETAARYAAHAAGWSSGTCPDCAASKETERRDAALGDVQVCICTPDACPPHCPCPESI